MEFVGASPQAASFFPSAADGPIDGATEMDAGRPPGVGWGLGGSARDLAYAAPWVDRAGPEDAALEALERGDGASMPHLERLQAAFGHHDLSTVRVHNGASAAGAASGIGALAYTSGEHIATKSDSLHDLAHEAAHVVQQRGAARPSGVLESASDEAHADAVADAVVAGSDAQPLLDDVASPGRTARAGTIARIKDLSKGGASVDIGGFTESQCYYRLKMSPMTPGTVDKNSTWEWEAGDKEAIQKRLDSLKGQDLGTFEAMLSSGALASQAQPRQIDPATLAGFRALVDSLRADPRIVNFDDWFYSTIGLELRDPEHLLDSLNELRSAQTRLQSLPVGQKLDLSEQATGAVDDRGNPFTADASIVGGTGPNQVEVKTVRKPCSDRSAITEQVTAGLDKFAGSPANGHYEVDVYGSYVTASWTYALGNTGSTMECRPDPAAGQVQKEITLKDGSKKTPAAYDFAVEIRTFLNQVWAGTSTQATRVNVTMENGKSFVFTKNDQGGWT